MNTILETLRGVNRGMGVNDFRVYSLKMKELERAIRRYFQGRNRFLKILVISFFACILLFCLEFGNQLLYTSSGIHGKISAKALLGSAGELLKFQLAGFISCLWSGLMYIVSRNMAESITEEVSTLELLLEYSVMGC